MRFHIRLTEPPTCPLRPMIPDNACSLRITAAAGTELAGASSEGTSERTLIIYTLVLPLWQCFTTHKAFITHAASLHHTFVHCGRFSTAASRRSLGRISIPVWPDTLSGRLPIVALVGHYPTNKLMGRGPINQREVPKEPPL